MPTFTHFGDASTVVGDRSTVIEDRDTTFRHDSSPVKEHVDYAGSKRSGKGKASTFVTTDYTLEDRPFFVPIGQDGLVAALQKLDRELKEVSDFLSQKMASLMICP
jgi:hypothetical protein